MPDQAFVEKEMAAAKKYYNEALRYNLPRRNSKERSFTIPEVLSLSLPTSVLYDRDCEIYDTWRELIKSELKDYFGISIKADFFNVGNLKEDMMQFMPLFTNFRYKGTGEEKAKHEAIASLYWELKTVDEIKSFFNLIIHPEHWILFTECTARRNDMTLKKGDS